MSLKLIFLTLLTMRISIQSLVTPKEYDLDGFNKNITSPLVKAATHKINTQFHLMKFEVKIDQSTLRVPESIKSPASENRFNNENNNCNPVTKTSVKSQEYQCEDNKSPNSAASQVSVNSQHDIVRCACEDNEDDDLMIQCVDCGYWQHGVCFCILNNENTPDDHFCHLCGDVDNPEKPPTDFYMNSLKANTQTALGLWRRTLQFCSELKSVNKSKLCMKLSTTNSRAGALLYRLQRENFITSQVGKKENGFHRVKRNVLLSQGFSLFMQRLTIREEPCQICTEMEISSQQQELVRYLTEGTVLSNESLKSTKPKRTKMATEWQARDIRERACKRQKINTSQRLC